MNHWKDDYLTPKFMEVYEIGQNQVIHFALCLNNEGYKASLEVGKLYRMIADEKLRHTVWYESWMKVGKITPFQPIGSIQFHYRQWWKQFYSRHPKPVRE